jgi:ABC-type dipeptide/oligopeptide/nickel transport system permease subunit
MAVTSLTPEKARISKPRTMWGDVLRKLSGNLPAMMGFTIIVMFYLLALTAPLLVRYEYDDIDLDNVRSGPTFDNPFGTDELGRDVYSRVIWASRSAAFVSIFVPIISLTLGIVFGTLSGYFGRWVDVLIMRTADVLFAFPDFLFIIFIAATIKPSVLEWARDLGFTTLVRQGYVDYIVVFTALGIVGWPGMARLVRGQFLSLRRREFVLAAQATGLTDWQIAFRHVLPNALTPVIVVISGGIGGTIAAETGLSFLGIGLQPPNPSWGGMISDYYGYWRQPDLWVLLFIPSFILTVIILAFTFFGDGVHEAMNPYLD